MNNDGFDDVIIGAPFYTEGEKWEGAAFLYYGSKQGLSAQPVWGVQSNRVDQMLGRAVRTAGDVNGDGFDDVIIGAPTLSNHPSFELTGSTQVYFGSAEGLSPEPDWSIDSNQFGDRFGRAVASAGDVNADGYDDILIGAYFHDRNKIDEGGASLFLGSASGPSKFHDWAVTSGVNNAGMGWSVSAAGDVNGDGFDDIIIGAPQYENNAQVGGRAFAYYGSASGLAKTADWAVSPNEIGADFGRLVAFAGDINGDGFDDVMVSARMYDVRQKKEGAMFVFFGSPEGLQEEPGWMLASNESLSRLGHYGFGVGDVDGDGFDDIAVGIPGHDGNTNDEGLVLIYPGSPKGVDDRNPWVARTAKQYSQLGASVGYAGDVDGDGLKDVLVGAWTWSKGENNEGLAFLYSGKSLAKARVRNLPMPMKKTGFRDPQCITVAFNRCFAEKYH